MNYLRRRRHCFSKASRRLIQRAPPAELYHSSTMQTVQFTVTASQYLTLPSSHLLLLLLRETLRILFFISHRTRLLPLQITWLLLLLYHRLRPTLIDALLLLLLLLSLFTPRLLLFPLRCLDNPTPMPPSSLFFISLLDRTFMITTSTTTTTSFHCCPDCPIFSFPFLP